VSVLSRRVGLVLGALAAVVATTWLLEHAVPAPYSGYLAVVVLGLVGTEVYKRQPLQRAMRLFGIYLKARAAGADPEAARDRLLARLYRDLGARRQAAAEAAAVWVAETEKERVVGAVGLLLARRGTRLDARALEAAWDRVRDRFVIAGWEALPRPFVAEVRGRLDEREQAHLDALAERHQLFRQRFFRSPSSLEVDPAAAAGDFARLLTSLGNRLSEHQPGDAERAYRLSLHLRPERSLAHAGLALLLERTGRTREAAAEAQAALDVLDEYVRRAAGEPAPAEDISPFRTPTELRQALERAATGG
jgi:glycosyltransferase involved in cell wall biosynthesis